MAEIIESVDADLDRLISRRASQDRSSFADPDEIEPGYVESVRRYNAQRRREIRAAWYGWHLDQAERHRRTLGELVSFHEAQAAKMMEAENKGDAA